MDDLRALLKHLYDDAGENLANEVCKKLPPTAETPSPTADERDADWTTYIVYPDAFFADNEPGSYFRSLQEELSRIKDLGCNAVHILPVFASPGFDMGFDVSDFLKPNERYGNLKDLEDLLSVAKRMGLKVILDLILNHISIEHEWFQKALSGDKRFSSYFITTSVRPTLLERSAAPGVGEYARYQLNNQIFSQRIIFPTQCDPQLPHWEKVDQQDWYFFHTFYPHQVDLDWECPDVFLEFAKIIIHWAERGVSFRLDAIPFIGRNVFEGDVLRGTDGSTERTIAIVTALRRIQLATAPDSAFLVEASEPPNRVQRYLDPAKAQLAYNFQATMALWAAVASENPRLLLEHLPERATDGHMLIPIRTHDGILLEHGSREVVEAILDALLKEELWPDPCPKEVWDRQHDEIYDVPGRSFSLLGEEPKRVLLMHFLAACLPGSPMVYYGDELGIGNSVEFMLSQQRKKIERFGSDVGVDFRELNRGPVHRGDMNTPKAGFLSEGLKCILKNRPAVCRTGTPEIIEGLADGVLGLKWKEQHSFIYAYANLTCSTIRVYPPRPSVNFICKSDGADSEAQTRLRMPAYAYVWLYVP